MSEYQELLDRLQLPQGKAAAFIGATRRTSNSYARGKRPVPVPVLKLLRVAIGLGGIEAVDALVDLTQRYQTIKERERAHGDPI